MDGKGNYYTEKSWERDAMYPLHIVEIDHVVLDIDVVDSKAGCVHGRPLLTLGIDVFSRMIWCMHLSFEPPSGNTLLCAVENGVFPKDSKGRFGTTNEWEVHGVPDILSVDNGLRFRTAEVIEVVCRTLNTTLQFHSSIMPQFSSTIDRLFGQMQSYIRLAQESTAKGVHMPGIFSFNEVHQALVQYVVDVYSRQPHWNLSEGTTPVERYQEGVAQYGTPRTVTRSTRRLR